MLKVTLRPSRPEDVQAAIPLIYSSGPFAFNYVFSDRYPTQSVDFLKAAFVWGNSEFGYKQHIVAVLNDEVVGIGGVRFANQNFRFTLAAASAIFRFYSPLGAIRTITRGLKIEQILKPPKRGVGIIYQLGVAPDHQSKGVGSQLIQHLLEQIEVKGMDRAALDVSVANPRAQALYEREGFSTKAMHKGNLKSQYGKVIDHNFMDRPV